MHEGILILNEKEMNQGADKNIVLYCNRMTNKLLTICKRNSDDRLDGDPW